VSPNIGEQSLSLLPHCDAPALNVLRVYFDRRIILIIIIIIIIIIIMFVYSIDDITSNPRTTSAIQGGTMYRMVKLG